MSDQTQDTQVTRDGDEFTVTVETNGYGGGTPVSLFMTLAQMYDLRAKLETALEEAGA